MPPPGQKYRRTLSSERLADMAFPVPVDQIGDRSIGRFALINPDPVLLREQGFGTQRAQGDFVAFALELKGVTGAEVKFLAPGLGDQDPSGPVNSKLRCHNGSRQWENPVLEPFLHTFHADHGGNKPSPHRRSNVRYTGGGFFRMAATRKNTGETDLQSYYRRRIEPLAQRLLDLVDDLSSKESEERRREFEDHVERRLQNGAKFVPRKRHSR